MATRTVTTKYRAEAGDFIATQKAMRSEVKGTTEEMKAATRQSLVARQAELGAAESARTAAEAQDRAAKAARDARDAELEAAAARKLSADAARSLADGGTDAAEAQRLEADAASKTEHAELANAEAQRLAADAANKVEHASIKAAAAQLAQADAAKKAAKDSESAFESFLNSGDLFGLSGSTSIYLGAAIAAAAPTAASLLGAALVTGVAGAGIGAAIAGQINNPVVRSAWKNFGTNAKAELTNVTADLAKPLAQTAGIFTNLLRSEEPNFDRFFQALTPEVTKLANGIAGFLSNTLTALPQISRNLKPVISTLSTDLPELGSSVSALLRGMTSDSQALSDSLDTAFLLIEGTLEGLAYTFEFLEIQAGATFAELDEGAKITQKYSGILQYVAPLTVAAANAWSSYRDKGKDAADATNQVGGAQSNAATKTRELTDATNRLNTAIDTFLGDALDVSDATLQFKDAEANLSKTLRDNKNTLDENTNAGRQNVGAWNDAVRAALQARDAYIKQGKANHDLSQATKEADATFNKQINALIKQAEKAGLSKQQVDKLLKSMGLIRDKTGHIYVKGTDKARAQVNSVHKAINDLPASKTITIYLNEVTKGKSQSHGATGNLNDLDKRGTHNRWGSIHSYATGGIYQSGDGLIKFAEPATGGEAYVPRLGDTARSKSILDVAAAWYGGTISWPGGGSVQSSQPVATGTPSFDVRVFVGNQEITNIVRTEIKENNRATKRAATSGTGTR
jgi:hypothetical protein